MKLGAFLDVLDAIAPLRFAEEWDNVGLLMGDPRREVSRVLVAIDLTSAVQEEAERLAVDVVVAYHPPIFQPLKRIEAQSPVAWAMGRGVAVYSPHTALDVAEGGTNDVLADILGMRERRPLRVSLVPSRDGKLVTFLPHGDVERVAEALFRAGAGEIGKYSRCSFRTLGTGTFLGSSETHPRVGQAGEVERVDETRLEVRVPRAKRAQVLEALRRHHPYEEPAFDELVLEGHESGPGVGRTGAVDNVSREELVRRTKVGLGVDHVLLAGPTKGDVTRVAVCAGAGGSLLELAIRGGAEFIVTGEVRHHDALVAASRGVSVLCTRHSVSERVALASYAERIRHKAPELHTCVSVADRDPFQFV